MHVLVVDLDMGNIQSLTAAVSYLGASYTVSKDSAELSRASHVILPGVGAFDAAMAKIDAAGWRDALREWTVARRRPLLGVCLGMQLLHDSSDEGTSAGLGLARGRIVKLAASPEMQYKVPHVGFAPVYGYREAGLFEGLGPSAYFYFTHSYALPEGGHAAAAALCRHTRPFVAAFQEGNLCGVQFHPEKSQATGLKLLGNFLKAV